MTPERQQGLRQGGPAGSGSGEGCEPLQQRSQAVLQGARQLGGLIRAVLNQHKGAGPFHTQVDQSLGRGVPPPPGEGAGGSLQPRASPVERAQLRAGDRDCLKLGQGGCWI